MNNIERQIAFIMCRYRHGRRWMPDRWFVELEYEKRWGTQLNIKDPKTLGEKMQWLKLHDHNPINTIFADKFKLKEWFRNNIGEEYTVPTIKTYTNVQDINLDELPEQFAIKCNHDSGSVFICYDKSKLKFTNKDGDLCSWEIVISILNKALQENYFYYDREWPYKNIKPHLIMVEPLLTTKNGDLPNDIKIFFANGEYWFTNVTYRDNGKLDRCTYDEHWERLPFVYTNPFLFNDTSNTSNVPRPHNYEEMLRIGKIIASYCKFVRVDFYDLDQDVPKIGEVTFYNGGGHDRFYPDEYDMIYGEKLKL